VTSPNVSPDRRRRNLRESPSQLAKRLSLNTEPVQEVQIGQIQLLTDAASPGQSLLRRPYRQAPFAPIWQIKLVGSVFEPVREVLRSFSQEIGEAKEHLG
jgi:hypothetical protein